MRPFLFLRLCADSEQKEKRNRPLTILDVNGKKKEQRWRENLLQPLVLLHSQLSGGREEDDDNSHGDSLLPIILLCSSFMKETRRLKRVELSSSRATKM